MSGFLINLIRVGMVLGWWAALGVGALQGMHDALVCGGIVTTLTGILVGYDARKAWRAGRGEAE